MGPDFGPFSGPLQHVSGGLLRGGLAQAHSRIFRIPKAPPWRLLSSPPMPYKGSTWRYLVIVTMGRILATWNPRVGMYRQRYIENVYTEWFVRHEIMASQRQSITAMTFSSVVVAR